MNIVISQTSGQPIYEQIARQIKGLILRGELCEGAALPSMRLLARDLRISVITTPGKGCYVAPRPEGTWDQARQKQVEEYLRRGVEEAKNCAMGLAELTQLLQELYRGEK